MVSYFHVVLFNCKPFVTQIGLAIRTIVGLHLYLGFFLRIVWCLGVPRLNIGLCLNIDFSRSSTEAEYRSMSISTAELFWLRMLFKELAIPLSLAPVLWCDNVSTLALASNPIYHARTKHIEVDYHFIRKKVLNGDILIKFISTLDQVADIFTKGLYSSIFLS